VNKRQGSNEASLIDASSTIKSSATTLSRMPSFYDTISVYGFQIKSSPLLESCVLSQEEMFTFIFIPLLNLADDKYQLSHILFEYVLCLLNQKIIIQHFISELLAQLYLETNQKRELLLLLQHGALPDSLPLAQILLNESMTTDCPLSFQLGIDILKRLEEHEEVIRALISKQLWLKAIQYASKKQVLSMLNIPQLLDSSYQQGDKTDFLNVYKSLENRGLIPVLGISSPTTPIGDLNRFISIYREIWGEVVNMEPIHFLD
jgi:hypothetical protein